MYAEMDTILALSIHSLINMLHINLFYSGNSDGYIHLLTMNFFEISRFAILAIFGFGETVLAFYIYDNYIYPLEYKLSNLKINLLKAANTILLIFEFVVSIYILYLVVKAYPLENIDLKEVYIISGCINFNLFIGQILISVYNFLSGLFYSFITIINSSFSNFKHSFD